MEPLDATFFGKFHHHDPGLGRIDRCRLEPNGRTCRHHKFDDNRFHEDHNRTAQDAAEPAARSLLANEYVSDRYRIH
jgi:hypothetical protein